MNLSFKSRNLLSFLAIFLIFSISIGGSSALINSLLNQQDEMIKNDLRLKSDLQKLQVSTLEQNNYALQFVTNKDEALYEFFTAIGEENLSKLKNLSKTKVDYSDKLELEILVAAYENYLKYVSEIHGKIKAKEKINFSASKSDEFIFALAEKTDLIDKEISNKGEEIKSSKSKVVYGVVGLGIFSFILIIFLQRFLGKSIDVIVKITRDLKESAVENNKISENVSSASDKVSSSVTQQASARQETSASLEEIKQTMRQSTVSTESSLKNAKSSSQIAVKGKDAIERMIGSINEISNSNDHVSKEFENSNKDISKIVDMIRVISDKTSIINDIVFQTRLLSFNASVEAARAGEHGKGFAVVAQEIGNLATMSGSASDEIDKLLKESIEQVEKTVKNSTEKIEKLMNSSSTKVKDGVEIAHECGDILENIVKNANEVSSALERISISSKEQSEGLENISTAMQELDVSTHTNSFVATETSKYSNSLKVQTQRLNDFVTELEEVLLRKSDVNTVVGNSKEKANENKKSNIEKLEQKDFDSSEDLSA